MIMFLAVPLLALAQSFATVSGAILDPHGAVLPGARVMLVNAERQSRYEVASDRSGRFEFAGLASGRYQLQADVPGFRAFRATLDVAAGAQVDRTITMEIGHLQETVTVVESAAAPPAPSPARAAEPRPNPPCPQRAAGSAPPVGGNLRPPMKIRSVSPEYPAALRGSGKDATVVLETVIGLDGFVKDVHVREPADGPFADALAAAVREWRFDSTLLNCVPVEVKMTVTGNFNHRP
jgi:TonB family protein